MSISRKGEVPIFVSRLAFDKVYVVWRINDFNVDKEKPGEFVESPQFWFSNASWILRLQPFKSEYIGLNLMGLTSSQAIHQLKGKFQFIGSLGDPLVSREFSETSSWKTGWGFSDFLSRDIFLKRSSEFLSPNKTLIVKCEIYFVQDKDSRNILTSGKSLHFTKELFWELFRDSRNILPPDISAVDPEFSLSDNESFMKIMFGTLFQSATFSDVALRVGNKEISAHRIILCYRSKVFQAMLENDMKEKNNKVIDLKEIDVCVATEMLRYMYTENVNALSFVKTLELYAVADQYDLQDLRDKCRIFLIENLNTTNVCDVIVVADLHSDVDLGKRSREYFENNIREILQSQKWMTLEKLKPEFCVNLLRKTIVGNIVI